MDVHIRWDNGGWQLAVWPATPPDTRRWRGVQVTVLDAAHNRVPGAPCWMDPSGLFLAAQRCGNTYPTNVWFPVDAFRRPASGALLAVQHVDLESGPIEGGIFEAPLPAQQSADPLAPVRPLLGLIAYIVHSDACADDKIWSSVTTALNGIRWADGAIEPTPANLQSILLLVQAGPPSKLAPVVEAHFRRDLLAANRQDLLSLLRPFTTLAGSASSARARAFANIELALAGTPPDEAGVLGGQDMQSALRTLGLGAQPSSEEVRRAYREQLSIYHPDKWQQAPPEMRAVAESKTREIRAAHDMLSHGAAAAHNRAPPQHDSAFGAERAENWKVLSSRMAGADRAASVPNAGGSNDGVVALGAGVLLGALLGGC